MIKSWFLGVVVASLAAVMVPVTDAQAKRLGGSKSTGMQRQTPTQPVQKAPDAATPAGAAAPAAAATPAAAAAATKAAAPAAQAAKRSWMGPLMGLAAGLGLAALFSSLGMGEGFQSVMMILLLAMIGFFLFRFIMSRFGNRNRAGAATDGLAAAGAGAAGGNAPIDFTATHKQAAEPFSASSPSSASSSTQGIRIGSALAPAAAAAGTALDTGELVAQNRLPADFDKGSFERIAKTIFVRLQAANDERNLDDLRGFSTPEMFAELRTDLLERDDKPQHTEVLSVNPTIVDFADEGHQRVVSVRYVGVIREEKSGPAEPFDETWHLVQTGDGPAWRIGGIQINA